MYVAKFFLSLKENLFIEKACWPFQDGGGEGLFQVRESLV